MKSAWKEVQLSLRAIHRSPALSVSVLLTLALGIAATTAVFSAINAAWLRPLPLAAPDRLVVLLGRYPDRGIEHRALSYQTFQEWRDGNTVLEETVALSPPRRVTLTGVDRPSSLFAEYFVAGTFELLGVRPLLGRTFTPSEERDAGSAVALISHRLWQELFGGAESVLEREIQVNHRSLKIVGVVPPHYRGLNWDPVDLWLPTGLAQQLVGERTLTDLTWLIGAGRLKPGVSVEAAREAMNQLAANLESQSAANDGLRVTLYSLLDFYYRNDRTSMYLLLLGGGLVLLICCANVAGLLSLQLAGRAQEMAVRLALGASRLRLVRLLGIQAGLLSLGGGAIGLGLAALSVGHLLGLSDLRPASFDETYLDLRVVAFAAGLSLVSALLMTLLPALGARLFSTEGLRGSARSGGSGSWQRRLRKSLVAVEIALALSLSAGGVLMLRSLDALYEGNEDGGRFDIEQLLAMSLELSAPAYDEAERRLAVVERLIEEATALPGAEAASVVGPRLAPRAASSMPIEAEGGTGAEVAAHRHAVSPGHFDTLGVSLVAGRSFNDLDDESHPKVAIVSQSIAEVLWPGLDPLDRRLRRKGAAVDEPWLTVVGVVPNLMHRGADYGEKPDRDLYFPLRQTPLRSLHLLVRADHPAQLIPALRGVVQRLDPSLPVNTIETMEARFALNAGRRRFLSVLLGIFSGIAVTLAVVGVYGTLAHGVRQRRQELGVRVALGAAPSQLRFEVLREGFGVLAAGVVLGLFGCWAMGRLLSNQLFGVRPTDPVTLASVLLLVTFVTLLAAYLPARRATRVDPVRVLRAE